MWGLSSFFSVTAVIFAACTIMISLHQKRLYIKEGKVDREPHRSIAPFPASELTHSLRRKEGDMLLLLALISSAIISSQTVTAAAGFITLVIPLLNFSLFPGPALSLWKVLCTCFSANAVGRSNP